MGEKKNLRNTHFYIPRAYVDSKSKELCGRLMIFSGANFSFDVIEQPFHVKVSSEGNSMVEFKFYIRTESGISEEYPDLHVQFFREPQQDGKLTRFLAENDRINDTRYTIELYMYVIKSLGVYVRDKGMEDALSDIDTGSEGFLVAMDGEELTFEKVSGSQRPSVVCTVQSASNLGTNGTYGIMSDYVNEELAPRIKKLRKGSAKAKLALLEEVAYSGTAEDVNLVLRKLGPFAFTARAFACACMSGDLEKVKALMKLGLGLDYSYYGLSPAEKTSAQTAYVTARVCEPYDYSLWLIDRPTNTGKNIARPYDYPPYAKEAPMCSELAPDPQTQQEIFRYLLNSMQKRVNVSKLYYYAILWDNQAILDAFDEAVPPLWDGIQYSPVLWKGLLTATLQTYPTEKGVRVLERLAQWFARAGQKLKLGPKDLELNARLFVREPIWSRCEFGKPDLFVILKALVDQGEAESLKNALNWGWLQTPEKRDTLIDYASGAEKTEMVSLLLEYKKRTADSEAEAMKEEKKLLKTLNATPTEILKKLWSTKKQEDGTLIITGYKGTEADIVVPEKIGKAIVTKIGEGAFSPNAEHCTNRAHRENGIKTVVIPDSVTSTEWSVFSGCASLESVTISASIKHIEAFTFHSCTSLTSVKIPDSVTYIGNKVFENCTSLTSITIPNSVECIGVAAFQDCTALASIQIPNRLKDISVEMFKGCTSLASITISDRVTAIGENAFEGCTSLANITIPSKVKKIVGNVFLGCTALENIVVDPNNSAYYIEGNCLIDRKGKRVIWGCKESVIPNGITEIGDGAFSDCTGLISIHIPAGVARIGSGAFWGCSSLTSVVIPEGVKSIDNDTFYECRSLTNVKIPESVKKIGESAFHSCSSLTGIAIPEGVKAIDEFTFAHCSSLTDVQIPNSVKTIDRYAFEGCSKLTSVTLPRRMDWIHSRAFTGCNHLTIQAPVGGCAEEFAIKQKFSFKAI